MKLVGIVNSADFKEEVLDQRELLRTEFRTENKQAASNNEQILDILKEINPVNKYPNKTNMIYRNHKISCSE